ncbi:DinB family protein [Actinokineospora enzanensis]|uniref:DinB family protein n=1 Tax=Actinokineospora enzanensis TaxID=155975 RepID=UPI0003821FB6|nr:DinB family protein [Actinokineospora enzanensis]
MDRCEECGYEYDPVWTPGAARSIAEVAASVAAILRGDADLRTRPAAEVWSPLEYGCHLRDVLLVQRERLLAARRGEQSDIVPMGRDERVDHDGYGEQEPEDVARQLTDAAALLARVIDRLEPEDLERVVRYPYPAPVERTVEWVVLHTLHEGRHHELDIKRQLT